MQARQAYQYLSPGSVLLKVRNMLATQGFVVPSLPIDAAIRSKLKVIQIHCPEKRCRWNIYDAKPANNGDLIQPHHKQCLIGAHRKNGNSEIYGPGHESVVSSQVYAYYSLVLTDSFLDPNISKHQQPGMGCLSYQRLIPSFRRPRHPCTCLLKRTTTPVRRGCPQKAKYNSSVVEEAQGPVGNTDGS